MAVARQLLKEQSYSIQKEGVLCGALIPLSQSAPIQEEAAWWQTATSTGGNTPNLLLQPSKEKCENCEESCISLKLKPHFKNGVLKVLPESLLFCSSEAGLHKSQYLQYLLGSSCWPIHSHPPACLHYLTTSPWRIGKQSVWYSRTICRASMKVIF